MEGHAPRVRESERQGGLNDSPFETTALKLGGVAGGSALGEVARTRAKVLEMTQTAEDAVLAPAQTGAWSHDHRAALAARIARLNGDRRLADHYAARIGDEAVAALAHPENDGGDPRIAAAVAFTDRVAARTREVTAEDVEALKAAGISDADIVRLAELNAFLAYQIRLLAGLRLMRDAT